VVAPQLGNDRKIFSLGHHCGRIFANKSLNIFATLKFAYTATIIKPTGELIMSLGPYLILIRLDLLVLVNLSIVIPNYYNS